MLKLSVVAIAAVLLAGLPHARAEQVSNTSAAPQALAARLDALLATHFKSDAPGATVIVVKDGKTLLRKAYGLADAAKGIQMTPETTLRLGSITKQFTAAGILLLADEGKLSLSDPITRFFPDYPAQGKTITVEHLLTHTSGIASFTRKPDYLQNMANDVTVSGMIDSFKNDPLDFEPGTRYRYNNSGYFLLGAIIENVSGLPYARFLEQRIFVPLGMNATAYEGYERSPSPRAAGHTMVEKAYGPARALSMTQPYAAGSLVSNVDDLAKWEAAIAGGRLLKPETWRKAFTPYRLASGEATAYGYGWHVGRLENAVMLSHGGGINGFRSHALLLPEHKLFVALLVNSDRGSVGIDELARKAAALVLQPQ